jgi:hypothetical protein
LSLGGSVEASMLECCKNGNYEDATWSSTFRGWEDVETRHALDHLLLRATLTGGVLYDKCLSWVVASDAHDGCGKKLFNSVMTNAANLAIVGCPQV